MLGKMTLGSIGLVMIAATQAAAADTPPDKLGYWEGHWKFQSEVKNTPYTKALTESGDGHCAWQFSHRYMVCEYIVDKMTPDDPDKPDNLTIYHYSDADKSFKYTSVTPEGTPSDSTVSMDGNTWTVTYQVKRRNGGTADVRHIQHFLSPTKWTMRAEVSVDRGGHWTEISRTVSMKVG